MISTAYAQSADAAQSSALLSDPTFWVAISFVIFVLLAAKPSWKFIASALAAKIEEIREKIEEATKLREEAQEMLAEYKRKLADAEKEAGDIITQAREEAQLIKTRMTKDLEASLQRRKKMAMDRIAQAEFDAAAEVRSLTAEIALDAARQVIQDNVTGDKASSMIDDAIKDLPEKLN
jgi:F-type H+-transporting ATPase subunit b